MNTNLRVAPLVLAGLALVACSSGEQTSASTRVAIPASNVVVLPGDTTTTTVAGGVGVPPPASAGAGAATTVPAATSTTLPPATTVPASTRIVTITQGEFNTSPSGAHCLNQCKYVDIQASGFEKGETLTITCFANVGSSGPYIKTADRSGSLHSTTACFFGNVSNVYVTVNEITSNVVTTWKDW